MAFPCHTTLARGGRTHGRWCELATPSIADLALTRNPFVPLVPNGKLLFSHGFNLISWWHGPRAWYLRISTGGFEETNPARGPAVQAKASKRTVVGPRSLLPPSGPSPRPRPHTPWRAEESRPQLIAAVPPVQRKKRADAGGSLCSARDWLLVPGLYSLFNSTSSTEPVHLLLQEE